MSLQVVASSLDAAAYFPSLDQSRNTLYYSRAKRYPRLPARRQDLRLTAEQTPTKCSAQFLIYHSPTNDILIFATEAGVRLLRKNLTSNLMRRNLFVIQGNFHNSRLQGSFFHFCQVVLRQVGWLGLRNDYIHNQELREKVKILMAEAFFPVNLIPLGFKILNVWTSGEVEPCSTIPSRSGFLPLKFSFGMSTLIIDEQGKTETVVRRRDSVRGSAAY
ncbi:hypothetical protein T12_5413 [Trichinella patagoniensis]|uniref:Uncharacterized protein n=1 Tax=Trichinella patagoniensis TaxID=990121 RepID=A0A0V0Z6W1_9BILA|nr:hypothetical protein T12_5413 [Trichinella patagoniensis]